MNDRPHATDLHELSDGASTSDGLLQNLLPYINRGAMEFPITLQSGGLLVMGVLVSGRKYIDAVKTAALGGAHHFDNLIEQCLGDVYPASQPGPDVDFEPGELLPQFLHLENAHFVTPGGATTPRDRGVWWRGRLSAVDGYTFGVLENRQT